MLALDVAAETVEGGTADEVGRELRRGLLGTDDLAHRLPLGLEGAAHQQLHRLVVGHVAGMHLVVEDRIDHRPQVKLELLEPQLRSPPPKPSSSIIRSV